MNLEALSREDLADAARFRSVVERVLDDVDGRDGLELGPRERMTAIIVAARLRLSSGTRFGADGYRRLANALASALATTPRQYDVIRAAALSAFDEATGPGETNRKPDFGSAFRAGKEPPNVTRSAPSSRGLRPGLLAAAVAALGLLAAAAYLSWDDSTASRSEDVPTAEPGISSAVPRAADAPATSGAPERAPLTDGDVDAAADAIAAAAGKRRRSTLWYIAEGLEIVEDQFHTRRLTYRQLQLHSSLPTGRLLDLSDPQVMERLIWAYLYLEQPGRTATVEQVARAARSIGPKTWNDEDPLPISPPPAEEAYRAPWTLTALYTAAPLVMLVLWAGGFRRRKRRFIEAILTRRQSFASAEVPATSVDLRPIAAARRQLAEAARHLAARSHVPTRRLDVEATLAASLSEGGFFTPRYARQPVTPEYLAVVLTEGPGDQEADRLSFLVEELSEQLTPGSALRGISADPAGQERQLERVYLEHDADRVFVDRDGPRMTLNDLAVRTAGRRLILLGTGEGLLDPVTLAPKRWTESLALWPVKAMATPVPVAHWGRREAALSGLVEAPLFSSTSQGLSVLAAHLRERDDESADVRDYPWRMPRIWLAEPSRWLAEVPLDEGEDWAELNDALARYLTPAGGELLDSRGYEWLAALAIYPALRWDVTSYLGLRLKSLTSDDPARPLYDDELAARLGLLPWFRRGCMPSWVRRRLIATLPKERRRDVIAALRDFLFAPQAERDAAPSVRLPVARIGSSAGVVKAVLVSEDDAGTPGDDLAAHDAALMELLEEQPLELVQGPRRSWRERMRAMLGGFGFEEWLWTGLMAAYAAAAVWLAPAPWQGPAATGSWWPAGLLAIGLLMLPVVRLLWRPRPADDGEE